MLVAIRVRDNVVFDGVYYSGDADDEAIEDMNNSIADMIDEDEEIRNGEQILLIKFEEGSILKTYEAVKRPMFKFEEKG
jgi:hypothetical protein